MKREDDHCSGCLRTLDEIEVWRDMSEAERQEVIADLPIRRQRFS